MKSLPSLVLVFTAGVLGSLAPSALAASSSNNSRALKIIQSGESNFPAQLAASGINTGRARAVVNIDADGKLADFIVTSYSQPEFAREAAESLRAWKYEAARENGTPVGSRVELDFLFEARGMVVSLRSIDDLNVHTNRLFQNALPLTSVTRTASQLDRPLTTVEVVRPQHPGKLVTPVVSTGAVVLDFYVDAEGRARMPVVVSTSHEVFALAAVDALSKWKFAPPTSAGKPVAVRVRQEFVFRSNS